MSGHHMWFSTCSCCVSTLCPEPPAPPSGKSGQSLEALTAESTGYYLRKPNIKTNKAKQLHRWGNYSQSKVTYIKRLDFVGSDSLLENAESTQRISLSVNFFVSDLFEQSLQNPIIFMSTLTGYVLCTYSVSIICIYICYLV